MKGIQLKRLAAVFAVVALVIAGVNLAPASPARGASSPYYIIYEDGNATGDHMTWHADIPYVSPNNLGNYSTGLTPSCNKAFGFANANWNDCITSVKLFLDSNTCVKFYQDSNATNLLLTVYGEFAYDGKVINMTDSQNDRITSMRWSYINKTTSPHTCPGGW